MWKAPCVTHSTHSWTTSPNWVSTMYLGKSDPRPSKKKTEERELNSALCAFNASSNPQGAPPFFDLLKLGPVLPIKCLSIQICLKMKCAGTLDCSRGLMGLLCYFLALTASWDCWRQPSGRSNSRNRWIFLAFLHCYRCFTSGCYLHAE